MKNKRFIQETLKEVVSNILVATDEAKSANCNPKIVERQTCIAAYFSVKLIPYKEQMLEMYPNCEYMFKTFDKLKENFYLWDKDTVMENEEDFVKKWNEMLPSNPYVKNLNIWKKIISIEDVEKAIDAKNLNFVISKAL